MSKERTIQLVISAKDKASKIIKATGAVLRRFGSGALKSIGLLTGAFGALGVAMGAIFKKFADQIDEQAKVAASLGLANESLGVFRDAAEYAGISSENLTTALRKMSQGIADAANGTGEAKDALERLGLDAAKLQQQGPEQAFKAIIEQLDKLPQGIEKTNLAMDLFGRSGSAMANLTAKGLRQAQEDADALKLKLTSAQAAHVEAANDAWGKIKNAASDFMKYITARLAPGVESALGGLFEWLKKQDLAAWAAKAAKGVGTAFQAAAVIVGGVAEAVIAISRGLAGAVSVVNSLTKDSLAGLLSRHVKDLDAINAKIASLSGAGVGNTPEMQSLVQQREDKTGAIRDTFDALQSAREIEKAASNIAGSLAEAQGFSVSPEATKAMRTLSELAGEFESKTEGAKNSAETVGSVMKIAFSGTAEAAEIAGDRMARINSILEDMRAKANSAAAAIASIPPMPSSSAGYAENLEKSLSSEAER